jgi:MFS family permease
VNLLNLSRANTIAAVSFITLVFSPLVISAFSLILTPIALSMGWTIGQVSVAPALFYFVSGVASLISGRLVERFGTRKTLALSLVIGGIACLLLGSITQLWQLYLLVGVVFPFASSGTTVVVVSVLISDWFQKKKGTVLSLVSTGLPFGQLFLLPVLSIVLLAYGWRFTYLPLGAALFLISAISLALVRSKPALSTGISKEENMTSSQEQQLSITLSRAIRSTKFWIIAVSYFACGFTDFLVTTELPSFALNQHFYAQAGAYALSIVGGANILGLVLAGRFSDISGPRITLALTYLTRLVSMLMLVFLIKDVFLLYLFSFVFGATFFTTSPLTANLVRQTFGGKNMASILGTLGLVHSIGGGLGVLVGGYVFDVTGSYTNAFVIGTIILLVGTISAFVFSFVLYKDRLRVFRTGLI